MDAPRALGLSAIRANCALTPAGRLPTNTAHAQDGTRWELPETPVDAANGADLSLGARLKEGIEAIQYGEVESPWSVLV